MTSFISPYRVDRDAVRERCRQGAPGGWAALQQCRGSQGR